MQPDTLAPIRCIVGYNDEITDIKCLPLPDGAASADRRIALATNSSQIRLFELATMGCRLLFGHTDLVLALDVSALQGELVRVTQQCRSLGEDLTALRSRARADSDEVAALREENRRGRELFGGGRPGQYIDLELEEARSRLDDLQAELRAAERPVWS